MSYIDANTRIEIINTSKTDILGAYRGRNFMLNKKPIKHRAESRAINISSLLERANIKLKELSSLNLSQKNSQTSKYSVKLDF